MLVIVLAASLVLPIQAPTDFDCSNIQRHYRSFPRLPDTVQGFGSDLVTTEHYQVPASVTAYGLPLRDLVIEVRTRSGEVLTTSRLIVNADWDTAVAAGRARAGVACSNTDTSLRCDLPEVRYLLSSYKVSVRRLNTGVQMECAQIARPTDDDW
ncbi:hypothetical protein KOAAANKH_01917 [Brevundimonas sp. NIBR10]|uniref:hypothetical protein n=1 Tax=Brevundimonas sp. NIBR10 TaxID=3015997 RepID=UPI0022F14AD3|nr:hypothetical protein [Brevundimonas sp. NIBR10]WGM47043.1 hypothetical protein KOAAANKH_01917 [Brevundimonas sp. NIBR10]